MLIILSAALLPLGLIALFASIESAQTNRLNREAEARLLSAESARQLSSAISRTTAALRGAEAGIAHGPLEQLTCQPTLEGLALAERYRVNLALFDASGRRICGTAGLSKVPVAAPVAGVGTQVQIWENARLLRFAVSRDGRLAIGEFPQRTLADISAPSVVTGSYGMTLRQGDAEIPLASLDRSGPLNQTMTVASPVAGGQLMLEMMVNVAPIRATEVLLVLLPLLMWLAAAAIGWLVVDRLLLRPLAQMQRAIAAYDVGEGPLALPAFTTPAQEIRRLGEAFRTVTEKVARHESELERGLARQTKLTREVHHRVKNNLQVVSSLINLHSRGAQSEEAGTAYASIQRRVDALAVVHRNHYAELEENRGVGLRPLIGELASNLRATASATASHMTITLELMPAFASQDVAVPVAFLITELVELVMACDPQGGIAIRLRRGSAPDRAELSLAAPGLNGAACQNHPSLDRFSRVLEGLARQLRSPLHRDEAAGIYAIEIAIVPDERGLA